MITFYTAVLIFPQNIDKELKRLRRRYNRYTSYSIDPHITLKQPFRPKVNFSIINEKLRTIAKTTKPFTLILNGVEYFEGENNVVYIAIKNKKPVINLHNKIVRSLKDLVKEKYKEGFELKKFVPHVTIGEEIPDKVFPTVKKELSGYNLNRKVKINSFSFYVAGKKEVWKPINTFNLSKK